MLGSFSRNVTLHLQIGYLYAGGVSMCSYSLEEKALGHLFNYLTPLGVSRTIWVLCVLWQWDIYSEKLSAVTAAFATLPP